MVCRAARLFLGASRCSGPCGSDKRRSVDFPIWRSEGTPPARTQGLIGEPPPAGGGLLRGFLSARGPRGFHPLGHRLLLFGRHRTALPRRCGVGRGLRYRGGRSRRPPRGGTPSCGLRRSGGPQHLGDVVQCLDLRLQALRGGVSARFHLRSDGVDFFRKWRVTSSASAATPLLVTVMTFGPLSVSVSLCGISVDAHITTTSAQANRSLPVFPDGRSWPLITRSPQRSATSVFSASRVPGEPPATSSFVQCAVCIAWSIPSTAKRLSCPLQRSQ